MSRFLNEKLNFSAYVPGEQPKNKKFVKLNTNESPFPPSQGAFEMAKTAIENANLYCDTQCALLREKASEVYGVPMEYISAFNGSDEALSFAFYGFGADGVAYPSISYGFYPVFSKFYGISATEIPLKDDLSIDFNDYLSLNKMIVIANPNAPTGLVLSPEEIEKIVLSNPNNVVVIDEAYIEFGAESVVPLTKKYENLLVTRTFSKSYSLAGLRLGFAIGNPKLIEDLNRIKFSFNPYNVSAVTQAVGVSAFIDNDYYKNNCQIIAKTRDETAKALREIGFEATNSQSNFLFVKHSEVSGKELFNKLRENGFLVRWFDKKEIDQYLRISVGSVQDMTSLVKMLEKLTKKNHGFLSKIKNLFK